MKTILFHISTFVVLAAFAYPAIAQDSITLDMVTRAARENYPLLKQKELTEQTGRLNVENIRKALYPSVSLNAQATYQSAVTMLPIKIPNMNVPVLSKDQYRGTLDVNQIIFDGGAVHEYGIIQESASKVENGKTEIELTHLKEKVQGFYMSVLLLQAQIKQIETGRKDVEAALERTAALVKNGTALASASSGIKIELLRVNQRLIELNSGKKSLIDILSLYSGLKISENTKLGIPRIQTIPSKEGIRPELLLLNLQDTLLTKQFKLITAKNLPRISAFVQGGYGKPGLNMLENEFKTFYMTGIKLNWQLTNLYTYKNERTLIEIQRKNVGIQKDLFELNQNAQLQQLYSEIEKFGNLIESDREIISLKQDVLNSAKAQYDNGSLSYTEYIRELNGEEQARENLELHTYQLIQAQINYKTLQGN